MFKKRWKYSKLRFYVLNTKWNIKFWLLAKPLEKDFQYMSEENYDADESFHLKPKRVPKSSKRFSGWLFEGNVYLDNPGIQKLPNDVWQKWHKKGWL